MAKFVTIGYGDQAGYDSTDDWVKAKAHKHDAWLIEHGSIVGIAGEPIQVRDHGDFAVQTQGGAFLRSDLPVAGFALIETADAEEAVRLVSGTPCAVANGVVEVWPLLSAPSDQPRET